MASKANFPASKLQKELTKGALKGLELVAFSLQKQVRKNLSRKGSGVHYKGNPTQSSREGEPPAAQTGMLRSSWTAGKRNMSKRSKNPKRPTVIYRQVPGSVSTAIYAPILEDPKRLNRPFIAPAVARLSKGNRAGRIMSAAISASLRKANRMVL